MMANEKRLININKVINEMQGCLDENQDQKGSVAYQAFAGIIECLKLEPTVDAVEVVRCKDCKHCTVTSDGMICECALPTKRMMDYYIYGSTILARVAADAFCSHGERRCE